MASLPSPTLPRVTLVLASASPARLATLRAAGIDPEVVVSDIDEDLVMADSLDRYGPLGPAEVALLLARAKCQAVASRVGVSGVVVGCDSVLELDGEVHGRPANAAEAVARWRRMRGRPGVLHTGHWIRDERERADGGGGGTLGATASTTVHFAELSNEEIEGYVATGEPLQVAGAFTIDGLGGAFVTGIEGDHHNVVGLSLPLLRELLGDLGIDWFEVAASPSKRTVT